MSPSTNVVYDTHAIALPRDLYSVLDVELKSDLAYAWSLAPNRRFLLKMECIQERAYALQTTPDMDFIRSRIAYLIRAIKRAVVERIELSRLQLEGDKTTLEVEPMASWDQGSESEMPSLVD
ncbi:hypothetical protein CVT26_013047 [Gymnopilus dilepis]|uniref:Uncharacterized protein n=1 Tax=Gymnopilus dilepis TaxID=231916 RepID=A0A409X0E1_9AGAR|nr:hypothetical protein CVT26_013047 [Gymnopilus dilepis]